LSFTRIWQQREQFHRRGQTLFSAQANETLQELNPYKPLVTCDHHEVIRKIKEHTPQAGLALRLQAPNPGAMVERSSKFGGAIHRAGGRR
jgi:hypothetical protein